MDNVLSLLSRTEIRDLGLNSEKPTVSLHFTRRSDKPRHVLAEWWPSYPADNNRLRRLEPLPVRAPFSSSTPLDQAFVLVAEKGKDVQLLHNGEPHPWFDVARILAEDYKAKAWPEQLVHLMHTLPSKDIFTAAVTAAYDRHMQMLYHDRKLDMIAHGAVHAEADCSGECALRRSGRHHSASSWSVMQFGCGITCETPLAPIGYHVLTMAAQPVLNKIATPHIKAFTERLVADAATITTALLTPYA